MLQVDAAFPDQVVVARHLHPRNCLGAKLAPMKAPLRPLVLQCAEPSRLAGGVARGSVYGAIRPVLLCEASLQARDVTAGCKYGATRLSR
jgi:hypothetical protein